LSDGDASLATRSKFQGAVVIGLDWRGLCMLRRRARWTTDRTLSMYN